MKITKNNWKEIVKKDKGLIPSDIENIIDVAVREGVKFIVWGKNGFNQFRELVRILLGIEWRGKKGVKYPLNSWGIMNYNIKKD